MIYCSLKFYILYGVMEIVFLAWYVLQKQLNQVTGVQFALMVKCIDCCCAGTKSTHLQNLQPCLNVAPCFSVF